MQITQISAKITFITLPCGGTVFVENRENKTSLLTIKGNDGSVDEVEFDIEATGFLDKKHKTQPMPPGRGQFLPSSELAVMRQFHDHELAMVGIKVTPSQFVPGDNDSERLEYLAKERSKQCENYLRITWLDELKKLLGDKSAVLIFWQSHTFLPCDNSPFHIGGVFYAEFSTVFLD